MAASKTIISHSMHFRSGWELCFTIVFPFFRFTSKLFPLEIIRTLARLQELNNNISQNLDLKKKEKKKQLPAEK